MTSLADLFRISLAHHDLSFKRANEERRYRTDPVAWARDCCGFKADRPQSVILSAIDGLGARVVVESCNGSGKTTVAAIACLRHLDRHQGLVVTTSGGGRQVSSQLWKEIRRWGKGIAIKRGWEILPDSPRLKTMQSSVFAIGFSAEDPGRAEGWHDDKMLFIVDEAKAIKDKIWDAIDSTLTNANSKLLIVTVPSGPESVPHRKAQQEGFKYFRIVPRDTGMTEEGNLMLTDRTGRQFMDMIASTYGRDSAQYRARVLAEAVAVIKSPYFTGDLVPRMFANYESVPMGTMRGLAVDWGRRIDYTVVTEWHGKRGEMRMRTQRDYMEVIGEISAWHRANPYTWIIVDEGEGRGQLDRMRELGLPAEGFNFGASINGAPAKALIMSTLHTGMEVGDVGFKFDPIAEEEFNAFESVPTSDGTRTKFRAAEGYHDDIVCSVAMGYWKASQGQSHIGVLEW